MGHLDRERWRGTPLLVCPWGAIGFSQLQARSQAPVECVPRPQGAPTGARMLPHTRACLHAPPHVRTLPQPLLLPAGQSSAGVLASPSEVSKEAVY